MSVPWAKVTGAPAYVLITGTTAVSGSTLSVDVSNVQNFPNVITYSGAAATPAANVALNGTNNVITVTSGTTATSMNLTGTLGTAAYTPASNYALAAQTSVPTGYRNRIINGDMRVDQRNAGASQTITAAAALAYTVDRFYAYCTGANVMGQQVVISNAQKRYRFTGAAK